MNPIFAKVVADSISPDGIRLTTMHLHYPRMIHAEFMTHRVFSRNGRSSRAVPTARLLQEPIFIPTFHGNKPGMQAAERLEGEDRLRAEGLWQALAEETRRCVQGLHDLGVHKQWANRPLEWFGSIDVLVTSTDWANFFALRDHEAAQPEIRMLAQEMLAEMCLSEPTHLGLDFGGNDESCWHLPYVTKGERQESDLAILQKLSVARCARISYEPFDGNASIEKELERYDMLVGSHPVHASPAEHQATPDWKMEWESPHGAHVGWMSPTHHGNLVGWRQFRKMLPNEAIKEDGRNGR